MDTSNPSPMRVLVRPPHTLPPLSTASLSPSIPPLPTPPDPSLLPLPPASNLPSSPSPPPPPPPPTSPQNGVVVVGFIGRRNSDVSPLINRIIDSNVFGSGNLDKTFCIEKGEISEEVKEWFKYRRISYYHEKEKGILYLQFCSTRCPVVEGVSDVQLGFDSFLEELEFGDLKGMLFMFSVCHVIIFVQEASRFDTQILKKFRVLQAAKHSMAPFVRSQIALPLASRSHNASSSRTPASRTSSGNPSPGGSGGSLSCNASAITLMSGLGSYTSLFPGQCTPVAVFVFLDEFSDVDPGSNSEDLVETSSINQPSGLNNEVRPNLPTKEGGSVVVLARPVSKSEGSFKKKLQSSLEAQIRFSIKKCRTLTGSETSHTVSRNGGISSSATLFSLDASKAVALVDRSLNKGGESLEFATALVEEVLCGKTTSDSLLLEGHGQSANKEDIVSVKEFIYRQSDILRGRSGLVGNTSSGSAAGVGMAAVAAAAAAASASVASGKTFTAPELPIFEIWLACSQLILKGILSAKYGHIDVPGISKRKPRQRSTATPPSEGITPKGADPLEMAVSYLESSRGLRTKFSTMWCHRALPVAKAVYLNELPDCYPTSLHQCHLEKALHSFNSMVKGPAVQLFMKKLEDECISIWSSGRQLCDAVSLTGKPCMHKRHDAESNVTLSSDEVKSHSSGFVFLHTCACGRSRRLRSDPFDFETANITSNCFLDCDKLLPALQLPQKSRSGPIQPSSWSLIRVGGVRYYDPTKGLLQSGFCPTQKFLLKWTIFLEKQINPRGSSEIALHQVPAHRLLNGPPAESIAETDKKVSSVQLYPGEMQSGVGTQRRPSSENSESDDTKISFGRGIPKFTMKKPFSEVVAGSAAYSGFPPLQSRKQPSVASEKGIKQNNAGDRVPKQDNDTADYQGSHKVKNISVVCETMNADGISVNGYPDDNPVLQIGSNVVPVNVNIGEKINTSAKHVTVYVGFEHECPHGHRFILNPEHLNELGSPYAIPQESHVPSGDILDHKVEDPSKLDKNGGHGKVHRPLSGRGTSAARKVKNSDKSKARVAQFSEREMKQNSMPKLVDYVKDLDNSVQSVCLNDGGSAFSLLHRSLPIYMNCPHCRISKNKKDPPDTKFAGTISQLQRIFLVTPPFPVILATFPVIQFEASCLPPSIPDREQKLQFSLGCQVILPPESFLSLRLPFVYGVELEDGSLYPLKPFENQPELTAWLNKGTTLLVMSKGRETDEELRSQNL